MSLLILAPEWCRFIHSAQVALNRTGPFIEEELAGKSLGGGNLYFSCTGWFPQVTKLEFSRAILSYFSQIHQSNE